jgi:hypothetical protein
MKRIRSDESEWDSNGTDDSRLLLDIEEYDDDDKINEEYALADKLICEIKQMTNISNLTNYYEKNVVTFKYTDPVDEVTSAYSAQHRKLYYESHNYGICKCVISESAARVEFGCRVIGCLDKHVHFYEIPLTGMALNALYFIEKSVFYSLREVLNQQNNCIEIVLSINKLQSQEGAIIIPTEIVTTLICHYIIQTECITF